MVLYTSLTHVVNGSKDRKEGEETVSNEEKVYNTLKEDGDWMTIAQVARETRLVRTTVSKYLWYLSGKGEAEHRQIGPSQTFRVQEG